MKRIFQLLIFMLFINNVMISQVTFNPGIKAGLNVSKFTGIDLSTKKDFYISAFGKIKFSEKYSLQPEIMYSKQGAEGTYSAYHSAISQYKSKTVDVSLQYLSISICNKIKIYKDFCFELGEFSDIIVADKIVENDGYKSISKGQDFDYGFFCGLGYQISTKFGVEGRIKKGLNDALDFNFSGDTTKMTNLVFQIGATYTFNFSKKK